MSRRRQAEIELYGKIMFLEIADQNENEYLETSFSGVKIIIRIVIELARDKFWIFFSLVAKIPNYFGKKLF